MTPADQSREEVRLTHCGKLARNTSPLQVVSNIRGLAWWSSIPANPNTTGVLLHGGAAFCERRGFIVRPWWIWA